MRILANYGCKTNGESYSVTFETMGDVGKDNVEATVDELFGLAKDAVKRLCKRILRIVPADEYADRPGLSYMHMPC